MSDRSVLIIDDEQGIARLCKRLLERAGFTAAAFTDPREGMEHLRLNRADLLLVDIRMPEVDGFDVIYFARQHQPDIAVLVMTGFGTVETAIQALHQGVDGLLLKPFERGEELVLAANQALADNQRKRDAARMQALRPLFDVTESLLVETRPDHLMSLIIDAVCGHLRCEHAGYYEYSTADHHLRLLAGKGVTMPEEESSHDAGLIGQADALNAPLCVNLAGPADASQRAELEKMKLSSVMCVPFSRLSVRSVLYAARSAGEPPFREVDLDMFLILARQAAIAMENAHLYAELRDYVHRVEESQQALVQAEKMAAAGRLTASIAHEINNPLQGLQNCLHLAGHEDLTPEKRQEYFDLARRELDRLMQTVQRMLEFYRPGAVSPRPVSVSDLLQHVLDLAAKQLSEKGITVQPSVPSDLPRVKAVSGQLQQVFLNLVLNSYDAMPDGGILKIAARSTPGGIEILFQDSGPGVPDDYRANVFEPFFSTKEGGTGLGLTVSYNIVTAHGGTLELVPGRGPGACFRVILPAGDEK